MFGALVVDGSNAVSNDYGLLYTYPLVRTKHHLKDASGQKQSPISFGYFRIPASTDTGLSWGGTHLACLLRSFIRPRSVATKTLDSNEGWITIFYERRTNPDVIIGSHLRGGLLLL
jgi:hypothetical protein